MLVIPEVVKKKWKTVTTFVIANAVIFTLFIQGVNIFTPNTRIIIVSTEECIPIVRQPHEGEMFTDDQ